MAKKKRSQLKPVARGFATTSVAKKVEPEAQDDVVEDSTTISNSDVQEISSGNEAAVAQSKAAVTEGGSDTEQQILQSLVDKFQDRVEKDITRAVKVIEQERRFADTLRVPHLDLDSTYIDQILNLASSDGELKVPDDTLDATDEKLLPRIAVTYGVLRRLGFTESIVETCLQAISGIGLDEACDWLHTQCSLDELLPPAYTSYPNELAPSSQSSPSTPQSPAPSTSSLTGIQVQRLNPQSPAFVPRFSSPLSQSTQSPFEASASEMTSGTETPSTQSPSEIGSSDDDLTTSYVKLKLRIAEITDRKAAGQHDIAFLERLQKRLKQVQDDYLFDKHDAEAVYLQERRKVYAQKLEARLRRPPSPPDKKPPEKPPASPKRPPPEPDASIKDVFDDASDDEGSGGLLGFLEQMPETETTAQGTTVRIRDLPIPKQWSGKTPRILLQETVHKLDRYAIVEFRAISDKSRAKRAAVSVRWNRLGDRLSEWVMEDVACYDESQAEQYIATVALHSLTFPPAAGFAVGNTAAANASTSFRLLPPIFRNLWAELEEQRKEADDATNRRTWDRLRAILEPKVSECKNRTKTTKENSESYERSYIRPGPQQELLPEQIIAGFQARLSSEAYQEMLQHRNALPIAAYRNEIITTLENNQILVLSGETGCGKSTQLPAFILEDQLSRGRHCKIYCTEPRRISAISLAQRVSQELGEPPGAVGTLGSIVGYSIRLESNTSKTTRLAYVTNGIALRMLESGSGQGGKGTAFDEITHIIIDEVHERSIESDFMLIVLKSLLTQRPHLKVVLMSATLDADKISNYFDGCPVMQVPGRTFPVEVQYLEDAIELTRWRIDKSSPYAIREYLQARINSRAEKALLDWSEDSTPVDEDFDDDETVISETVNLGKRYSPSTAATIHLLDDRLVPYELIVRLLEVLCLETSPYNNYSSAILVFMSGMGEIRRLHELLTDHPVFAAEDHFCIYPLHSSIASDQQAAVFDIPPPGVRKIVIATNIAETGITIPDITCVIDTGRQREMRFDEKRQLSRLVETYVAKSNAAQRRGRAGRVQPGICFHLFTEARHNTRMSEHPDPEMMRLSLSDLALRIKILKVKLGSSIEDVLSRALDPPSSINVQRAVSALVEVQALTINEDITPLGRLLSKLPTDVHLGKFLLIATVFRCLDTALTIAATLNSKSPFLRPFGKEAEAHRQKLSFRIENSDFLTLHNAFSSWRRACANGPTAERKFCRDSYLSHQNLQQIEELRQQFLGYLIDSSFISVDASIIRELNRARLGGRARVRFVTIPPEYDVNSTNPALVNAALAAGLYPKLLSIATGKDGKDKLVTITNNQAVSFHPGSVNFGRRPREFDVNYLSYFTIMQSKKMYAWETGPVDDLALVLLCGDADFKLMADSVLLDRKVRFRLDRKAGIALKHLRTHIGSMLASQFRGHRSTDSQDWEDIGMMVLGKVKPKAEEKKKLETVTLVVNRVIR